MSHFTCRREQLRCLRALLLELCNRKQQSCSLLRDTRSIPGRYRDEQAHGSYRWSR